MAAEESCRPVSEAARVRSNKKTCCLASHSVTNTHITHIQLKTRFSKVYLLYNNVDFNWTFVTWRQCSGADIGGVKTTLHRTLTVRPFGGHWQRATSVPPFGYSVTSCCTYFDFELYASMSKADLLSLYEGTKKVALEEHINLQKLAARLLAREVVQLTGFQPQRSNWRVYRDLYQVQRDNGTISDKDDKVLRRKVPSWIYYHSELAYAGGSLGIMGSLCYHFLLRRPFPRHSRNWLVVGETVLTGISGAWFVDIVVSGAVNKKTMNMLERPEPVINAVLKMRRQTVQGMMEGCKELETLGQKRNDAFRRLAYVERNLAESRAQSKAKG